MDYHNQAFTLLELLVTLVIFSLLSLSGLYYYQSHRSKTQLGLFARQLYADLSYAKEQAWLQQDIITLCPIQSNWHNGYDIQLNTTRLLIRTPAYPKKMQIQSHFGLNHPCVYFEPNGHIAFNGHFLYTHLNNTAQAKIIFTQSGKMHLTLS